MTELERIRQRGAGWRDPDNANGVAVLLGHRTHGFEQVLQHLHRIEIGRRDIDAARFDLGEIEDFVDQAQQVLGGREDAIEVLHGGRVVFVLGVLFQHFRIADDGVERCAQFVAHVGQELRFGEIGAFGGVTGVRQVVDAGFDERGALGQEAQHRRQCRRLDIGVEGGRQLVAQCPQRFGLRGERGGDIVGGVVSARFLRALHDLADAGEAQGAPSGAARTKPW